MNNLRDIILERHKKNIQQDVEKIIKYPLRSNIKISNRDVRELQSRMESMTLTEMKSLREFLTVTPVISKKRMEVGFSESKRGFGAFTIVTDTPHSKILEDKYPTQDKELTLEVPLNKQK